MKLKPTKTEPNRLSIEGFEDLLETACPGEFANKHVWAEPQLFLLPFCVPQHKNQDRQRIIKIVETVNVNGILKERKFKVIPDPDYGLPGAFDFEVMLVVFKHAANVRKDLGLIPEELELPPLRTFLRWMGRPGDGRYTTMLKQSLKRLAATNCVSEGFFYSKPRDYYLIENFQFLTAAHIAGEDDKNGGYFERTSIKLHSFIRENLQANFRTLIDFDFIRNLKTDIAKPLSLHLSYRFFKQGKSTWETDYDWLASRLAIKVQEDWKRAKEQLKPALLELQSALFIEKWEWLDRRRIRFTAGEAYVRLHTERVQNKDAWLLHQENEQRQLKLQPRTAKEAERLAEFDPLATLCTEYAANGWTGSVAQKARLKQVSEPELRVEALKRHHILKSL